MRIKHSTKDDGWILLKNGESAVELKFAQKPKKREHSEIYYFYFRYRDRLSGQIHYSRVSTDETDKVRAMRKRDQLYDKVHSELNSSEVQKTDRQPIRKFFDTFLLAKDQEGRSPKTLYDYGYCINMFVEYAGNTLPIGGITTDLLRTFLHTIASLSLRDLTFRTLRSALNFAVDERKLDVNPICRIKLTKQMDGQEPLRDWIRSEGNETDFKKIYEHFPTNTFIERTAKNAVLFAYTTASRLGEICHLKVTDIKWAYNELNLRNSEGFNTKNRVERRLRITPRIRVALQDQLRNKASHPNEIVRESPYLFCNSIGKPFTNARNKSSKISKIFRKVRKEVFPDRPNIHFHTLRHSYCQNAYNNGMALEDIAKVAGHKSTRVASRYARLEDYAISKAMHHYNEAQPVIEDRAPHDQQKTLKHSTPIDKYPAQIQKE